MPSVAEKILDFQFGLKRDIPLPAGVEWIYPYQSDEVKKVMKTFYQRFFHDQNSRTVLLGINPGRFGAGVTGVPFTDPVRLSTMAGIGNSFEKKQELSSVFVYDMIQKMGGPGYFYQHFYITSISPLGLLKAGKNYNYYDDPELIRMILPFIVENMNHLLSLGVNRKLAFSMGQGKNLDFLIKLNRQYHFFEKIESLPHPRWVMQYRLKKKEEYLKEYLEKLKLVINS